MVCDSLDVFIGCAWLVIRLAVATPGIEDLHLRMYDIGLLSGIVGVVLLLLLD